MKQINIAKLYLFRWLWGFLKEKEIGPEEKNNPHQCEFRGNTIPFSPIHPKKKNTPKRESRLTAIELHPAVD